MGKNKEKKIIAINKKARYEYFIKETLEAGIVLLGTEVKSIRQGRINLKESYAKVEGNEVFLFNCHISPYNHSFFQNHEPTRKRKLLLKKREIKKFIGKSLEKGNTLIPLQVYLAKNLIKIELGLGQGKKLYDKREVLKSKEEQRWIDRALKIKNR